MATVYLARDVKHHRQVAINVLKPELATSIGAERFLREIRVAALQHPNILGLYDSGEADGLLYYVMPFIEGESLRDRLDEAMAVARRAIAWHERGARNDSLRVDSAMESTVDGQRTNDARPPRLLTLDPRPSTLDPRLSTLDSRLSTPMQYLLLVYVDHDLLNSLPEGQFDGMMRDCLSHADALKQDGRLIESQMLEDPPTARSIRVRDGKLRTTDGPFAETKEVLGGFNLIEAADLEEATRIAVQNFPWASVGCIEVRPVREIAKVAKRVGWRAGA